MEGDKGREEIVSEVEMGWVDQRARVREMSLSECAFGLGS